MWSQFTNVTDGRTDGQTDRRTDRQTTSDRNTALCTKVHRAVKTKQNVVGFINFIGCAHERADVFALDGFLCTQSYTRTTDKRDQWVNTEHYNVDRRYYTSTNIHHWTDRTGIPSQSVSLSRTVLWAVAVAEDGNVCSLTEYSVSQQNPSCGFLTFFPKLMGIF